MIPYAEGSNIYEMSKMFYDGLYALYNNRDAGRLHSQTNSYFKLLGNTITPADYGKAAQNLCCHWR